MITHVIPHMTTHVLPCILVSVTVYTTGLMCDKP